MDSMIESFRLLPDEQLLAEVRILVSRERTATSILIASLAELDERKLFLQLGFSSLHDYCTRELGLSAAAAHNRITAARVARRFPVALSMLASGALTLTNVNVLSPHLTLRNHAALLDAAQFRTRTEVEAQVASLHPEAPDLVILHVKIRRSTRDKLRHAQELLRHAVPNGDTGEVLDRALTLLIAEQERRKLGNVRRPRRARKVTLGSRHIPAAVRRTVHDRDGGRCAFEGTQGRCGARGGLEFHHVVPFALGGQSTAENIQLRCRAHNQYEGEQVFGPKPGLVRERRPAYGTYRTKWDIYSGSGSS